MGKSDIGAAKNENASAALDRNQPAACRMVAKSNTPSPHWRRMNASNSVASSGMAPPVITRTRSILPLKWKGAS